MKAREKWAESKVLEIRRARIQLRELTMDLVIHAMNNWPKADRQSKLARKLDGAEMEYAAALDSLLFEVGEGYDLGATIYNEVK